MSSDQDGARDPQQEALNLLLDTYDLEECPKCELREEMGIVLGDSDCAIGVAVCPNCGHHSRCLTADPAGVVTEHPYDHMHKLAMRWVPDWDVDRAIVQLADVRVAVVIRVDFEDQLFRLTNFLAVVHTAELSRKQLGG